MTSEEELRLQAENIDLRQLLEQAGINAAEQKVVEQLQGIILEELHHRVKNMLATVTAIASQTLRTAETMDDARAAIESRLVALGRVHDLLLRTNWRTADLASILKMAIEPFDSSDGPGRFFIQTSDIEIASAAALPLGMALHELSTNAVKYGALSNPDGKVEIKATIDDHRSQFCLRWEEIGGPPVQPPTRRGFGTRLIQHSFATQFSGSVRLDFNPTGVVCEIDIPLAAIKPQISN